MAAELICRQLSAIAISTLGYKESLQAQWFGTGAAYMLVMSETPILGESRKILMATAAQRLDVVPDAVLEDQAGSLVIVGAELRPRPSWLPALIS